MKCKVSMRFNKEVDFKKVSIHVGNFAVTADGQKFFFDFKKKNFQYVYDVVYEDDTVFVLYEGEELDLEKYPDSLSLVRKLDKITKLEACDISADDATIYPVGVFGFVIESPYFYSDTTQCNKNHLFNTANTKVGDKKFITIDKKKPQNIIPLENRDDATYAPRVIFAFSFILLILSILGCIMDFIRKIKEKIPTD